MPPPQQNDARRPREKEGRGERLLGVLPVPRSAVFIFMQPRVAMRVRDGGLGPREELRGGQMRARAKRRGGRLRAPTMRARGVAVPRRVGARRVRVVELIGHFERVRWFGGWRVDKRCFKNLDLKAGFGLLREGIWVGAATRHFNFFRRYFYYRLYYTTRRQHVSKMSLLQALLHKK
jgi:hypothetical protein